MSEDEFWDMLPREFSRRVRTHNHRTEEAWSQTLLIVNHIRAALKAKPMKLEALLKNGKTFDPDSIPSKAQYLKDLARIKRLEDKHRQ